MATPAHADSREVTFWRSTSLTLSYAERYISNKSCYSNARYLLSCIDGINSAGAFLDAPIEIKAADRVQSREHLLHSYKTLALVSRASHGGATGTTVRDRLANAKRARDRFIAETRKSFSDSMTSGSRIDFEGILKKIVDTLPGPVPSQMALGAAISAHLKVFDPHSSIQPAALDNARSRQSGQSFVGIGINFHMLPRGAAVQKVYRGRPADLAGLHTGDIITQIDRGPNQKPVSTAGMSSRIFVDLVGGPVGTRVGLTVRRGQREIRFEVIRKKVDLPFLVARSISVGRRQIGYAKLRSFNDLNICGDLRRQLARFATRHVLGLVLDFRGDPGGYLKSAVCVSSLFLGTKPVVGVQDIPTTVPGWSDVSSDETGPVEWRRGFVSTPNEIPIVVLIDSQTASAAEIVSGALQAYGRAWLVGEPSYGKGSVQTTTPLEDNDTLDLTETTGQFYLPNGKSNEWVGIRPDFNVPNDATRPSMNAPEHREEDDYYNGLPPQHRVRGVVRPLDRNKIRDHIKRCVDRNSHVANIAHSMPATDGADDVRLAYAIGVLECSTRLIGAH